MRRHSEITRYSKLVLILALLLIGLWSIPGFADPYILIRLDYKIVLSPVDGSRPKANIFFEVSDAQFQNAVDDMNALLESYGRGYRMVLNNITEIGGIDSSESQWFDIDFFNAPADSSKWDLETAAENDPTRYHWLPNAINIYITNGFCGGISSFPPDDEIVVIGGCSAGNGEIQLHELGHYFGLCHTQGCPCGGCDYSYTNPCECGGSSCEPENYTGTCATIPGSDGMNDTLEDLPCWDLNSIADENFGMAYALLTPSQQAEVDVAATNNMSYHHTKPLCNPIVSQTEDQLDWWTDMADENANRRQVRDGYVRFVSTTGSGSPDGTSNHPYGSVLAGITAANASGGDIVLLRPGIYNEPMTISKPVTLRATRDGHAFIGTATPLRKPGPGELLLRETTIEKVWRLKAANPNRFDTTGTVCGTEWEQK